MPKPLHGRSRYIAGIDGLRALSVLAVIVYHLNVKWAPGGLLGVGIFFVLSGYLITDLLAAQWKTSGRLDLKDFLIRRARRLLPAMLVMLAGVLVWMTLFDPSRLAALTGDILSAITYVSNWWFIYHEVSYFESFGPPSPLGHLWSLAVEEQFYLIWPLVFVLGLRYAPQKGKLSALILTGVLASALAMALIYQPGADPSRVYYGTDTRAFALLIGAALAVMWPSRKLSASISQKARLTLDVIGGTGLLVVLSMILFSNEYDSFLYRGGFLLLSVATALVVATLAHPASRLSQMLGWKPLRWLGVRSYGIYLWHYPVIVLTSPLVNTNGVSITRAALQVAASIALAALSWRYIEEPIRHGALRRIWRHIQPQQWRRPRFWATTTCALLAISLVCVGVANATKLFTVATASTSAGDRFTDAIEQGGDTGNARDNSVDGQMETSAQIGTATNNRPNESAASADNGTAKNPGTSSTGAAHTESPVANAGKGANSSDGSNHPKDPQPSDGAEGDASVHTADPNNGGAKPGPEQSPGGIGSSKSPDGTQRADSDKGAGKTTGKPAASTGEKGTGGPPQGNAESGSSAPPGSSAAPPPADTAISIQSGKGITAIGDSVMVDVAPHLEKLLPGILVDGQIGRQLSQAQAVVDKLKAEGKLGKRVIIELGTNGAFTKKQLESLLHSLGDVDQIFLVNTRVPRPWEGVVNSTLAEVAQSFPKTTLVNWYAASEGQNGFFAPDGVHLGTQGAQFYASLLVKALQAAQADADNGVN